MISQKEVQHIAKLARIDLSDEEVGKFQEELASILTYFDILGEVDVSSQQAFGHVVPLQDRVRKDEVRAGKEGQRLLQMSPETKDTYVKVRKPL